MGQIFGANPRESAGGGEMVMGEIDTYIIGEHTSLFFLNILRGQYSMVLLSSNRLLYYLGRISFDNFRNKK